MSQDRSLVEEAFAGDIVGIHDPGVFKIGDTTEGESLHYTGIPVFAPEHFVRVELKDPLKSKQLNKALDQLSEEGAVQVFRPINRNDQVLGVVGVLQFDVVQYRIQHEYGVKVNFARLPYKAARWIHSEDESALYEFITANNNVICNDQYEQKAILLEDEWRLKFLNDRFQRWNIHRHLKRFKMRIKEQIHFNLYLLFFYFKFLRWKFGCSSIKLEIKK